MTRSGPAGGPTGGSAGGWTAELTGLEVRAELGRGASTVVHRVVRDGTVYALKRPVEDAADARKVAAFQREAALLGCIDDPAIPKIHAAGTFQGAAALVLEFFPGGSLADQLSRGPLDPEQVVALGAQLARGLAAAHRAGLVHRDVKPGNVMVAPGRPAKLIDFGLALLGGDTAGDTAVGTFLYTSPEQTGMLKRPVDGRSDLYSLGVMLFECLTGRLPFEASDVGELLRLHLTAPIPDPATFRPGVPPELTAVITRLLAKDPDDRYPDAAALLGDLRDCPGGDAAGPSAVTHWPLAGRDTERDVLTARWDRARAGHGGVARIRGAAGSGRTRLADEIALAVPDRPVLHAAGRADEVLPLAALRTALDHHLRDLCRLPEAQRAAAENDVREAARAAGAGLVAVLSAGLAELTGTAGGEGTDEQVFAAAAMFLGELATRAGGLALILDDAHWLDAGSRQVLARLAADLPRLPLLVVLAEADGAGLPVGVPADTEVTCTPLDARATAALIASRLPGAAVPDDLSRYVIARTGGSPLAAVAYLLRLLDAGLLTPHWGTWRFDEAGADALPAAADVRALLAARLATLAGNDRDVLVTAAVAGARFRTGTLIAAGGSPDPVVAAVNAAVDRRVLEARAGGWYVFLHPLLRASLLDGIGAERLRHLHAAVADALETLPEDQRDADHVYAVARHHGQAGDIVPAGRRRVSALAAGLRALADRAPAEAIGYLETAAACDPGPRTDVRHPLATAYLKAGRFAEAGVTLREAIAAEPDRRARARMLITEIELHHTVWADDRALDATARALAELRRPLPRAGVASALTALAAAFAGAVVRRTRLGFGTARGRRREDLQMLAAALDAGGYAAGLGLRLREAGLLAMRAMYAVNRLGPCPEYVRVYALIGYVAAVVKLRGTAERCLRRATRVATALGDPALVAYAEWLGGCARMFGGYDDGTAWLDAITRHSRWFGPAQLIPGYANLGLRNLLRGYVTEAQTEYERGLRRLPDADAVQGTSFSMLPVMIPAVAGRPGEAATALAALRAALPEATKVQRANIVVAAACATIEQGEFGEPFEQIVAEFRGLGLRDRELMTQHKLFYAYQTHGRMAQVRMATDEQRPARLAAARSAVADLRRVRRSSPVLDSAYLIGEAALAQLQGANEQAIAWCDKAEKVARRTDSPLMHFEAARFRARSFRQLGMLNEAERQAAIALALTVQYGWESRRRQARAEFGAEDNGETGRRTAMGRPGAGRNRRLEALQQVGAAAATVLDPRRLAEVALDEMLRILGAERALFFLLDATGEPEQFAGRSAAGQDLTETTAYGASLVRRVAADGEALVVSGTEQGAALGSRSVVTLGLRSVLVVPVRFKGTTLGVVYLDSRMARGIFTDDDVEVLTAVTSHIAVSLETARAAQLHLAVRTAQQQQAFAEMLRASLAELAGIHTPADLLRRLFATLHTQVGAAAGVLAGPDRRLVLDVAGDVHPGMAGGQLPEDVPETLEPALLSTVPDGPLAAFPQVLAVPLSHREGPAGYALFGGAAFDDSARQVALALATQGMTAYDNARLFSRVRELATTDELTGQHNRRHFYTIATALVDAAARGGRDLAAVMLDIDKFKGINDTYGHGVGDEVIRQVAARIRASIRTSDVLGRYGGEEFAVVLPDHDGGAADLAERMRRAVADEPIATLGGRLRVTISVGLARLDAGDTGLDQLLARADHALYRAKDSGRNRVVAA